MSDSEMAKKKTKRLLTSIEMDVLSQLIYIGKELYGLELMNRINAARQEYELPDTQYGSFYPALQRLEREGLVKSHWGDETDVSSSGARRKYYSINGEGKTTYQANVSYHALVSGTQMQGAYT
jgi:PadR family transcriptional regulator, regulatory protein PadR